MEEELVKNEVENLTKTVQEKLDTVEKKLKENTDSDIKSLKDSIEVDIKKINELDEKRQDQVDKLETEVKKLRDQGASSAKALQMTTQQVLEKSFKEAELSFDKYKDGGIVGKSFDMTKAAGNMTFSNSTTGQVVDNAYVPGIFGDVRRQRRIREIIPGGTMSGDKMPYVRQTGKDGTVTTVIEGGDKPQLDYDIQLYEAPARKIAAHVRIGEELLNDMQGISSFITIQATADIMDKEDQQLLYGTGSSGQIEGLTIVTGVLTATAIDQRDVSSSQKVDAVICACHALVKNNYMPDTIFMNPADVYDIMLLKATDGDYLKRINFTTDGSLVIKGIRVFESLAVTAGDFGVGQMSRAAQLYQRDGLSVRFFDQDQDNAVKNLVTVVIEERLALTHPYPNAIFYDSFTDVNNVIS